VLQLRQHSAALAAVCSKNACRGELLSQPWICKSWKHATHGCLLLVACWLLTYNSSHSTDHAWINVITVVCRRLLSPVPTLGCSEAAWGRWCYSIDVLCLSKLQSSVRVYPMHLAMF
jgi:hypothetical protein